MYLGQCVTISRVLGLHRRGGTRSDLGRNEAVMVPGQEKDIVHQEFCKRMFWIIFSTVSSFQQMGVPARELSIPPPTSSEPYPDLPIEIDDNYITPQAVHPMPQGEISTLVGFNANMKVYKAITDVSAMDLAYGPNELFDWDHQKLTLQRSLDSLNGILGSVPSEFLFTRSSSPRIQAQNHQYPPPTQGYPELGADYSAETALSKERKKAQTEIQKVNLYAAQMATRSYLMEKYRILRDKYRASHGAVDTAMENGLTGPTSGASSTKDGPTTVDNTMEDRDFLMKDLLKYLGHLDVTYLEPSGFGFVRRRPLSTVVNDRLLTCSSFPDEQDPPNCKHLDEDR